MRKRINEGSEPYTHHVHEFYRTFYRICVQRSLLSDRYVFDFMPFCLKLSLAVNPFIYCTQIKKLNKEIKEMFRMHKGCNFDAYAFVQKYFNMPYFFKAVIKATLRIYFRLVLKV